MEDHLVRGRHGAGGLRRTRTMKRQQKAAGWQETVWVLVAVLVTFNFIFIAERESVVVLEAEIQTLEMREQVLPYKLDWAYDSND
jgi:hypothetical protein